MNLKKVTVQQPLVSIAVAKVHSFFHNFILSGPENPVLICQATACYPQAQEQRNEKRCIFAFEL